MLIPRSYSERDINILPFVRFLLRGHNTISCSLVQMGEGYINQQLQNLCEGRNFSSEFPEKDEKKMSNFLLDESGESVESFICHDS